MTFYIESDELAFTYLYAEIDGRMVYLMSNGKWSELMYITSSSLKRLTPSKIRKGTKDRYWVNVAFPVVYREMIWKELDI